MKAWIGVASRDHVLRGREGGFAQLCHGKAAALRRMAVGDCLVYYSPRVRFEGDEPCRAFTAIGRVVGEEVYPFDLGGGFVPYRRDVRFLPGNDAPIGPLLARLRFAAENSSWGMLMRRGFFAIEADDARVIGEAMGASLTDSVPILHETKAIRRSRASSQLLLG